MKMASYKGFGKAGAYMIVMIASFAAGLILTALGVDGNMCGKDGAKCRPPLAIIAGALLIALAAAMFVCRDFLIRAIFG